MSQWVSVQETHTHLQREKCRFRAMKRWTLQDVTIFHSSNNAKKMTTNNGNEEPSSVGWRNWRRETPPKEDRKLASSLFMRFIALWTMRFMFSLQIEFVIFLTYFSFFQIISFYSCVSLCPNAFEESAMAKATHFNKEFWFIAFYEKKKKKTKHLLEFYQFDLDGAKHQRKVLSYKSNKTNFNNSLHIDKRNEKRNLNSTADADVVSAATAAPAAYVSLMTHFALSISILCHMRGDGFSRIHLEILQRAFRNSFSFTPVCPWISTWWFSVWCHLPGGKSETFFWKFLITHFQLNIFRSIALFFHLCWTGLFSAFIV